MSGEKIKPESHDFSDISDKSSWAFKVLSAQYGPELAAHQLALEHQAYTLGEEHFQKTLQRQQERGEFSDNATAKPILGYLLPKITDGLKAWIKAQESRTGRKNVAYPYFVKMNAESTAVIALKVSLNMVGKSGALSVQNLCVSIGKALEEEARFGRIRDQEAAHFKKHVSKALNKRNGHTYKEKFLEKVETHMLEAEELVGKWVSWESENRDLDNGILFHLGFHMLELLVEVGLLETQRENAGFKQLDITTVQFSKEWAKKLCERAFSLAGVSPKHQPMIVPPREWTKMVGGGYWAKGRKPTPFIRVRSKRALNRYRDVYMPEVYKAVNLAQQTAWAVNGKVLEVANKVMEWKNVPIKDFPLMDPEELPTRIEGMDEDSEVLKKWKKAAAGVYRRDKARVSRRLSYEFSLEQANKFSEFEAIYFPYNLDWRGRVYAIPAFNPQSSDMVKGLLQAAHGEPIGEEGIHWLKIHGANTAGVDKVDFQQRCEWVDDNESMILRIANDPLENTEWMSLDSPFCFLAFCFEWAGVKRDGVDYVSSIAIAFDGSCSGIQHFSAMLRDEIGGSAVNLVPSAFVQDIYRLVADRVNEALRRDLSDGTADGTKTIVNKKTGEIVEVPELGTLSMARGWLGYGVDRKVTKRSVMTLAYGSKAFGFTDQVRDDIIQPAMDRGTGQEFFADPQQCARYMANLIWDAVGQVVVKAVEAMKWLQTAAKLLAAEVKCKKTSEILKPCMPVFWVTPDGFPVWQEYMVPEQRRMDLMFHGTIRFTATVNVRDTDKIDGRKQESGIAPNFVHSKDGSHLRKTVVHAATKYGVTFFALIHDSFGTIAAKAGSMFKAVRETMVDTYEFNDVLADFREQFLDQLHETQLDKLPPIPEKGSLNLREILNSSFAFA